MIISNGNLFTQLGSYHQAPANQTITVSKDYMGNGWVYVPKANNTLRIEAPLSNVHIGANGFGTKDLVFTFENGARLNFWHFTDLQDNPNSGFFEKLEIDLFPFYGIAETVSIDFTNPDVWAVLNGTGDNDNFEDLIESRFGQDHWNSNFNTLQLGGLGNDELSGDGRGTDVLFGGPGTDMLWSSNGRNLVYGSIGDDFIAIEKHASNDFLVSGGAGNDTYLVMIGASTLVNSDWVNTGQLWTDGTEKWERIFEASTSLTPIYDQSGANDRLILESDFVSWGAGPGVAVRGEQVLNSDIWTRFEVVGNNLQIATTLTQSAINDSALVFLGRQADWWFRDTGFLKNDDDYHWGMTEQEQSVFNLKDATTYPGWNELNQAARDWLLPRLDPAYWEDQTSSYFDFVEKLRWRTHEVTDYVSDPVTAIRHTPRFDTSGNNLVEQAKANVAFDEANHSTWPYFEFSRNLDYAFDPNRPGLPPLEDIQSGVELLGFGAGQDSIETFFVEMPDTWRAFLADPKNNNIQDPIGARFDELYESGTPMGEAINGALAYALELGFWRELKTSHTGVATSDQAHLLVANQTAASSQSDVVALLMGAGLGVTHVDANDAMLVRGREGDDSLFSLTSGKTVMLGGGGNDWFELQGGDIWALGGTGEDTFVIRDHGNAIYANIVGGDGANDDRLYLGRNFNDVEFELFAAGQSGVIRFDGGDSFVNFQGIESIQFTDWLIADTSNPVFPAPAFELIEMFGAGSFFHGSDGAEKVVSTGGGAGQQIHTFGGNDWVIFEGFAGSGSEATLINTGAGDDLIDLTGMSGQVDLITGTGNDVIQVSSNIKNTSFQTGVPSLGNNAALVFELDNGSFINYAWQDDYFERGSDSIVMVAADGTETLLLDLGASLQIGDNNGSTIHLTSASTYLSFDGDDRVTGSDGNDVISTGAGNDTITLSKGLDSLSGGAGDDFYIINGPATSVGRSRIFEFDGGGFDTIQINSSFYGGTLDNPFNREFPAVTYINHDGDLVIGAIRDGKQVGIVIDSFTQRETVEAIEFDSHRYLFDRNGDVRLSDQAHYLVGDRNAALSEFRDVLLTGGSGDDVLVGNMASITINSLMSPDNDYVRNILDGGAGNDRIHGLSGINILIGGLGDDTFLVGDYVQNTYIIGDTTPADGNAFMVDLFNPSGANTINQEGSFDIVKIGWAWEDSVFETIGNKGQRIFKKNADGSKKLDQFVDIYDVEQVEFWNGSSFTVKSLVVPVVVNLNHLHYENDVAFRFGDSSGNNPDMIEIWNKSTNTFIEKHDRKTVSEFQFADQVVEIVQKLSSGLSDGDPGALIYDGSGKNHVQIIYGTRHNDHITGGTNNDFIFGGDGDDVLIGHMGNNVMLGGAGNDTIRGGLSEEDIVSGLMLSGSNDTLIIGGDGIDTIKSGSGKNFVASGRVLQGDQVDLALIHQRWGSELFNDDYWI